jgi:hypothetical protein
MSIIMYSELNKNIELSIKTAINDYRELHGEVSRVWVNPKDVPNELIIDNIKIERRGGVPRLKIMVF